MSSLFLVMNNERPLRNSKWHCAGTGHGVSRCVTFPYKLYTDASNFAVGAILVQEDDSGIERVIQYVSKQLTDSQKKWSAIEREAFGVIHAAQLRPYLQGATFTVYTDHKTAQELIQEIKNTRVQRWLCKYQNSDAKLR